MLVSSISTSVIGPHVRLPQGASHTTWEIAWHSRGKVAGTVGPHFWVSTADEMVVIAPGEIHSSWVLEEEVHAFVLHLLPHSFPASMPSARIPITKALRQVLNEMPQLQDQRTAFEQSAQKLVDLISASPALHSPQGALDERVVRAMTAVVANPTTKFTVESLASTAGLSPYHFSRLFREITGESPMRFVRARRLQIGKRMLETTSLTITRIGDSCGFGSTSRFSEAFRSTYGCTPTRYRKDLTAAL